jgi:hypothetical protein
MRAPYHLCRAGAEVLSVFVYAVAGVSTRIILVPYPTLECNTTHLTKFGGIVKFPTSLDGAWLLLVKMFVAPQYLPSNRLVVSAVELLKDFASIKFSTFSIDDVSAVLVHFNIAANPTSSRRRI